MTQAAVMALIREIALARGMAVLLITHDIALAAQYCDELAVMQQGRIVETGPTEALIANPREPYTQRLLAAVPSSMPSLGDLAPDPLPASRDLITARGVPMDYRIGRRVPWGRRKVLYAVDGIDLEIAAGEALGIVGESGCGKSTLARLIAWLADPKAGEIALESENLLRVPATKFARSPLRRDIQMVFQDPTESLAPHLTAFQLIADLVRRLLSPDTVELTRLVHESAVVVDLPVILLDRYPHQLSEGQKARVGLARAIASQPRLLVLDEPTSALDVSVQATVLASWTGFGASAALQCCSSATTCRWCG